MATPKGFPRCPEDCGGSPGGLYPHLLTQGQRELRHRWGCDRDAPQAQYTITCPNCDSSRITDEGLMCEECISAGDMRGEKKIRRCPTSHIDSEMSAALRHYPYIKGGMFPVPGGLGDQSPAFLHFAQVLSGECVKIQRQETDKASAASATPTVKRNR